MADPAPPPPPPPSRKECIANFKYKACGLKLEDNPDASSAEPIYEMAAASTVGRYSAFIHKVARETKVSARLIKAIMYMETTHGYYDMPLSKLDQNKSILPMNINTEYWGSTFGARENLKEPEANIRAGAEMLRRIQLSLPEGASVAHIATLYNHINAKQVSSYGKRVEKLYATQPWLWEGVED
jgi:hypothetical protein